MSVKGNWISKQSSPMVPLAYPGSLQRFRPRSVSPFHRHQGETVVQVYSQDLLLMKKLGAPLSRSRRLQ